MYFYIFYIIFIEFCFFLLGARGARADLPCAFSPNICREDRWGAGCCWLLLTELMEPVEAAVAAAAAAGTRRVGCSGAGSTEEDSSSMLLLHCAPLMAQLPQSAFHWRSRSHVTHAWTDRGTDGMKADEEKLFSSAFLFLLAVWRQFKCALRKTFHQITRARRECGRAPFLQLLHRLKN